jgi:hypothetical protein
MTVTLEGDDAQSVMARVAAFIRCKDWSTVRQGVELLLALGDSAALAELARGLSIDESDALEISDCWRRRVGVSGENAQNLALLLLASVSPSPLAEVRELDLAGLEWLTDIEPLRVSVKLEKLRLDACVSLEDGGVLGALPNLRWLSTLETKVYDMLPGRGLERLESLTVSLGRGNSVASLARMCSLLRLGLTDSDGVRDWAPLAGLCKLRTLKIAFCGGGDLTPLASLAALEELSILGIDKGTDCLPLSRLGRLRRLELCAVDSLDVSRVLPDGALPALEELDLGDSCELGGFRGIRGGLGIKRLRIFGRCSCFPEPIRDSFSDSLEIWRRSIPEATEAQAVLAVHSILDALLRCGPERACWPEVRACLAAALARGGAIAADFMLGGAICSKGRVLVVTSSLARRAAESIGAEWHDDAMVMLWDACGWRGLSEGACVDLSKASLVDRPLLRGLPRGSRVLLPDGSMIGNAV